MAAGVLYPTMAQVGEWNEQPAEQPRGMFIGTPEIYFAKRIDNSRVAKVADPKRRREMISFGITLSVLFLFVMVYLWQHFSAIEYGYRIEQLAAQHHLRVEPRIELGRGLVEGPSANRQAGQTDGYAAAGGRAIAAHGYGDRRSIHPGDGAGQRNHSGLGATLKMRALKAPYETG